MSQVKSRILPLAVFFCFLVSSTFAVHLSPEWSATHKFPSSETSLRVVLALQQNNLIELEVCAPSFFMITLFSFSFAEIILGKIRSKKWEICSIFHSRTTCWFNCTCKFWYWSNLWMVIFKWFLKRKYRYCGPVFPFLGVHFKLILEFFRSC